MNQIWNVDCSNCHATNLDRGFTAATKSSRTAWTEFGIGCEACHGPGMGRTSPGADLGT